MVAASGASTDTIVIFSLFHSDATSGELGFHLGEPCGPEWRQLEGDSTYSGKRVRHRRGHHFRNRTSEMHKDYIDQ